MISLKWKDVEEINLWEIKGKSHGGGESAIGRVVNLSSQKLKILPQEAAKYVNKRLYKGRGSKFCDEEGANIWYCSIGGGYALISQWGQNVLRGVQKCYSYIE